MNRKRSPLEYDSSKIGTIDVRSSKLEHHAMYLPSSSSAFQTALHTHPFPTVFIREVNDIAGRKYPR